jgi:hypothetical protein
MSQVSADRIVRQLERDGVITRPTKRERRDKLRRERLEALSACSEPFDSLSGLTPSEEQFAAAAAAKHGRTFRGGWPDFLVEFQDRTICVEVKMGQDNIRPNQAKMFAALERAGIPVFVWNRRTPDRLIPWRKYIAR